ncbi:hypothetical protein QTG56_22035 [Rossellomorea sp. AcN35-11]|nr:hypothetical protein [Rossellomorea aquimaris]WJV29559.1 hypothetical protein QTG56_22035 [Rossellomorea sp. AcN35-11]
MQFVKMVRFDSHGFTCSPPGPGSLNQKSDPVFINRVVYNLYDTGQSLYTTELFLPGEDDREWSGCYCFLEESRQPLTTNRTIGFIPKESVIWVKNRSHFPDGIPYFTSCIHPLVEEGEAERDNLILDTWVKMKVEDALERKRLWKQENDCLPLPLWLSECYLMEKQVKDLLYPSANEKVMEFWLSKN